MLSGPTSLKCTVTFFLIVSMKKTDEHLNDEPSARIE